MKKTKSITCTLVLNTRVKLDKIAKNNLQGFSKGPLYFKYTGKSHRYNLGNFVNVSIIEYKEPKSKNTFRLQGCSYYRLTNTFKFLFKNIREKLEITFDKNDFSNDIWNMLKIGNKYQINITEEIPFDYEKFEKQLAERTTK